MTISPHSDSRLGPKLGPRFSEFHSGLSASRTSESKNSYSR